MTRHSRKLTGAPRAVAAGLLGALVVAASPTRTAAQPSGNQPRSRILVGAYFAGDLPLGAEVVDSTNAMLGRLIAPDEGRVVSRNETFSLFGVGDLPKPPWPLDDVRELAKQVNAGITIEVCASAPPSGGVHLAPLLVLRYAPPIALEEIDAPSIGAASRALAEHVVADAPALIRRGIDDGTSRTGSLGLPTQHLDAQVFFEFQVEKQAILDSASPRPVYPPVLRMQNMGGQVLAQFVVDTTGVPDVRTFKVLKTPHDLFSSAVRSALRDMTFSPAEVGGRKVKQLVQMPFVFDPTKP